MNTSELIYMLGVITGLILGLSVLYPWGHRNGRLKGYQTHRDEVRDRKNDNDARRPPGAELEPVRAKTAPLPPWYDLHPRSPAAVPGGGRPFPRASSRAATVATDLTGPVFVPATGATRIPMRPQPRRDSGPGTETFARVRTTGEMQKLTLDTEAIIRQIIAGTWPPPRETT